MGITAITGSGECRVFTSGYKFDLKDYYRKDMNDKAYVLISLSHSARQGYATEDAISEFSHVNNFTCIPFEIPYRPLRMTPKPVVEGVQTAIVVGPAGEEIYTDEHGRVKVQFHWDREGKKDDKSSCSIRVSHVHAGKGFGGIDIPRIGEEVIIDFFEGDPDCPIITGRVYNGNNKPPNGLPGAGMVSGLKSNSTPGDDGYNKITMNDTTGKENITIHSQYDMNTTSEHDNTLTVHNNRTSTIDVDDTETVGNNQTINIGVNQMETIGNDQTKSIANN